MCFRLCLCFCIFYRLNSGSNSSFVLFFFAEADVRKSWNLDYANSDKKYFNIIFFLVLKIQYFAASQFDKQTETSRRDHLIFAHIKKRRDCEQILIFFLI